MSGDWIKMRVDLQDDPAVVSLCDQLEIDEYAVIGRLHRLWSWADKHTSDGSTSGVSLKWVDRYVAMQGFAEAMIAVGWLEFSDGILSFPRFEIHNGKSAKSRCDAVLRQRQSRERHKGVTNSGDERCAIPRPFVTHVLERDRYTCVYCGAESTNQRELSGRALLCVDHIVPHSRGTGRQAIEDLVTCCRACNNEKNDRTPEEWGILPQFLQPEVEYVDHMIVTKNCDRTVTTALPEKIREEKKINNRNTGDAVASGVPQVVSVNATDAAAVNAPTRRKPPFVKPTVCEIADYVGEINATVDAKQFLDYYESNGWRVGRNPMKDWKATVRQWHARNLNGSLYGNERTNGNSAASREQRNASAFEQLQRARERAGLSVPPGSDRSGPVRGNITHATLLDEATG